ncbi:MBL fold metallo-hydrolase [Cloacibacterium sp. TD35]|uniref:MBL fold metallo-hydrolase n=1 Tax=Cloacibacterium sp. TD35 TaxID=2976818 RepID=UPI00237D4F78|nr:MBL fold metallo-hydrolase [Cloacibacterium sp. TD35]WDT69189.1 MBL fold metallo-hydrolase [Cloacibacterium sp. TD35]
MLHIHIFRFNPFSENTYVLFNDQKNGVIIDPGNWNEKENEILENFIKEKEISIQNILLTHAHIDHVLGLQWAFDTYKVAVKMHKEEKDVLDRNPMSARNYGFDFKPFLGDIELLNEGEKYFIDEDSFEIFHVPGHSPGSLAFYNEAQKFVISGDALFQGSIGRTDLYRGNHEQLLESIRTKLFTLPEETEVYSGHGNATQIGFEKNHNPFF